MSINKLSEALRAAYAQGADDEMLAPHLLVDSHQKPIGRLKSGDAVIFYNIRGEREIQLTEALTSPGFDKFAITPNLLLHFVTMIEYAPHLRAAVAFPPYAAIPDTLSDVLAAHNIKQAMLTEAEKATHITFFLHGKKRPPYANEQIVILPTRKDITLFDEAPAMSLAEITTATLAKIADPAFGFILVNFPNADVVGHIENEAAILEALTAVDKHTKLVVEAARAQGMDVVICADHGSVEKWRYPDGAPDTGHTDSAVPFVLISDEFRLKKSEGELADVAPSVLSLFDITPPGTMSGISLVERCAKAKSPQRVLFLLLDGWGLAEADEANLIYKASTPVMDGILRDWRCAKLQAAGEAVGLPPGTVGNSEAGHLHIGAGRRVYSDRLRIERAVADGSFFSNEAFVGAMEHVARGGGALHLLGIVSFFSSHGVLAHLFALIEMARARGVKEMYLHSMLGRRGEFPESGARYLKQVEDKLREVSLGKVVSVLGRYWSLDREENWDRIEKTYRLLVDGVGVAVQEGQERRP